MTCEECRAMRAEELAQKPPETIPYYTHEKDMARMERANKRIIALCVLLIFLCIGISLGWAYERSQFEKVVQEVEQDADNGTNNFVGGDCYGTAEDQNYTVRP